jgi:uncharacterized RDD family membrane protein YckC
LTISLPIWLYFSFSEISAHQATLGKRLLKLKTLDRDSGKKVIFGQAILRTVVKLAPWEIAHLTNNLPIPMWYDPNPGFRIGFVMILLLITLYIILVFVNREEQSLHDLVAGTRVVRSA